MASSADIAAQLQQYDANKVDSTSALNDALAQYGVPEIRQNVAGLRTTVANTTNSLNAVDPSVTGRTQGSLVTEAQRQRQVANERAPIAQQLQGFTSSLGDNEKTLQDALSQATTQATNRVNDYNTGRAALQSEYDNTYKREQDAAQAEAARQAAAQQQANEDRNYQLSLAAQRASSAKSSAPSAAVTKQQQLAQIAGGLQGNTGKDGRVSNETWAAALNDFTSLGGTTRQFWQNYGQYVNPKYIKSYAGYGAK